MLEQVQSSSNPSIGHPVLREKGVSSSVKDLKHQIELFWNGDYPFSVVDAEKVPDPLDWWRDIGRHDGAKVLSVRKILINCGSRWEFHNTVHTRSLRLGYFPSSSILCQTSVQIQPLPGSTRQLGETR